MESGFSSPRADKFPAGLRVLVVDDDPTWLKILEKMLKKCSYQVTTCGLAIDALAMLRENKNSFDIVISDVNMPDMDGFKLLEHVGLEMDLPVIMMSVDGETSRVMKGVRHGACDYLLKPIRMKELSNIWQHVYRKKMHEVKDSADNNHDLSGSGHVMKNEIDDSSLDCQYHSNAGNSITVKKRKDQDRKKHSEQELVDPSSSKKSRVVWSIDLHQKFLDAVNHIGYDKLGPKKILDKMNVPSLTRDNVASHLQKYRLYLAKVQNDNDQKTSLGGIKHQSFSPVDSAGSFDFASFFSMDQKNAAAAATAAQFSYSANRLTVDDLGIKFLEDKTEGTMVSFSPAGKPKTPLKNDIPDPQKTAVIPQIQPVQTNFTTLDRCFNYEPVTVHQWDKAPMMQFTQPNHPITSCHNAGNTYRSRSNLVTSQTFQESFQQEFNTTTNPSMLMSMERQVLATGTFRSPPTTTFETNYYPTATQSYNSTPFYTEQRNSISEAATSTTTMFNENDTIDSCFFQGLGSSGIINKNNERFIPDLMDELGGALF